MQKWVCLEVVKGVGYNKIELVALRVRTIRGIGIHVTIDEISYSLLARIVEIQRIDHQTHK